MHVFVHACTNTSVHKMVTDAGLPITKTNKGKYHWDQTKANQVQRGGGGGTPLYKLYRYVPPQRVWFFSRFGLKMGVDFDHYSLNSGMVFKGTTGAYKRICLFNPCSKSIVEKDPKYIIRTECYFVTGCES